MSSHDVYAHAESWLLLPWLANGRLAASERVRVEEHVRACAACTEEVATQRRLCEALNEPERVTYAPGPSFRKLLERIDGERAAPERPERVPTRPLAARVLVSSAWRPPGLAWAASFVLAFALAGSTLMLYTWSQPRYVTHTDTASTAPGVLHIAFQRSLSIDELAQLLDGAGARVVEGPGSTGIFGVTPVNADASRPGDVTPQMRALAARLRADARVRWIEPLKGDEAAEDSHRLRTPQP
ncbi:MAG TPA: zf-HC2 domain-containing protein [Steroidobacteraceae bacterium]|nr:zf-HC2 domain-containing protein [Steroidobacteraceae bacterium]